MVEETFSTKNVSNKIRNQIIIVTFFFEDGRILYIDYQRNCGIGF